MDSFDPLRKPPDTGPPATADPSAAKGNFNWVAIRSLAPRHRPRILRHLLALDEQDRYLRFGHAANDAHISRYVDLLDFERDDVFGVFNRRLDLVALAHLAYLGSRAGAPNGAEFGVSVDRRVRGRGWGEQLFDRAALLARNRGVQILLIHALSENTAMLRIARKAGAVIERDGSESQARLRLPPDNLASKVEALVKHHVAEVDYGLKRHALRTDTVVPTSPADDVCPPPPDGANPGVPEPRV